MQLPAFVEQDNLRGLYQGFMKRDIKHITDFQTCRPKTDYYKHCVNAFAPLHTRFLSSLVMMLLDARRTWWHHIPSAKMFRMFREWAKAGGYQFKYNSKSFSQLMEEFEKHKESGLSKRRVSTGQVFSVDTALLKACLEKRGEFDEDAQAIPVVEW